MCEIPLRLFMSRELIALQADRSPGMNSTQWKETHTEWGKRFLECKGNYKNYKNSKKQNQKIKQAFSNEYNFFCV